MSPRAPLRLTGAAKTKRSVSLFNTPQYTKKRRSKPKPHQGHTFTLTPSQIQFLLSQRHTMSSIQSQSHMTKKTDHSQETTVHATEKRQPPDDIKIHQAILQTQKGSEVHDPAAINIIQMQQQHQQAIGSSDLNPQNIIHMQPQGHSGLVTQMVPNQNVHMAHGQPVTVQQQGSIVTQMNPPNIDQLQGQRQSQLLSQLTPQQILQLRAQEQGQFLGQLTPEQIQFLQAQGEAELLRQLNPQQLMQLQAQQQAAILSQLTPEQLQILQLQEQGNVASAQSGIIQSQDIPSFSSQALQPSQDTSRTQEELCKVLLTKSDGSSKEYLVREQH